jgi:hypothetical protein
VQLGGLVRYEWLLFELAVVGFGVWQLWSLNRDKRRAEREKAAAERCDSRSDSAG